MNSPSSPLNTRPSIQLHVERLVLDGLSVSSAQGHVLVAAMEAELTRLLAEQGLNHLSGGAVPHLSANSIQITHGNPPSLGHQIARAIYGSLTPATASPREPRFSGGRNQ
jgi:hypothetical protein